MKFNSKTGRKLSIKTLMEEVKPIIARNVKLNIGYITSNIIFWLFWTIKIPMQGPRSMIFQASRPLLLYDVD